MFDLELSSNWEVETINIKSTARTNVI
jgi:hypothetical protein